MFLRDCDHVNVLLSFSDFRNIRKVISQSVTSAMQPVKSTLLFEGF